MKVKEYIKDFWRKQYLRKQLGRKDRNVRVCNISDAKEIGIVYNANQVISYEIIKDLTKDLGEKGIKVNALGYVQSKQLIDHYLYRKGFDFFTNNDLNWYNKPISQNVKDFTRKPFDILINLCLERTYPIDFIVASSKSNFKVGKYFNEPNYLDLMIDLEKERKTMQDLHEEIKKDQQATEKQDEFETEVQPKIELEIQLNFLIHQIMHYLSMIKSNKQSA